MRDALAALPGVRHVDVDFDKKQAVVTAAGTLDHRKLLSALESAGFGGSLKDVDSVNTESNESDHLGVPSGGPPKPGLSVDKQRDPSVGGIVYSSPSFAQHVRISVFLDHEVLRPGDPFRIAVVFDIDDGWYIYGNPLGPGIGKKTVISARGPDGFQFESARYATGHRAEQDFGEAGMTWVWEHTGRTVHYLSGEVNDEIEPDEYLLVVEVDAQVCTEGACLPGTVTISLPVSVVPGDSPSDADASHAKVFAGFDKASVPKAD